MAYRNYKQIYAMKKQREDRIKKLCPSINNNSGIYVFYRVDEDGFRFCYVGQALHCIERCASHLAEYDHIALSLKKYGLCDEKHPYGWKLTFKNCAKVMLDENEKLTIKHLADEGWQLYNVSKGGQSSKSQLREYKQPKTYMQGIEQGRKNASKEMSHLFDLHLTVGTKKEPPTVNQQKALDKFNAFLEYHKGE